MKIDIGHDHSIEWVEYEGDAHAGLNDYHLRKDGTPCKGFLAIENGSWAKAFEDVIPTWTILQTDPLTLSPSILCRVCGDHGFIREGKWVPA